MKALQSVKNPVVQAARALDSARERKRQNAFLLDGEHMVGEALRTCPQRVQTLFVEEGRDYAALLALAQNDVYTVPGHVLAAISQVKTSQGIAAVCTLPDSTPLEKMGNRLVLLENVQDPGNVGTVLRTLDAAGFDGCVLTPGCADPFGPKALRATMGSVFRVPICQADSACQAVEQLNRQGWATIAAALDGQPFYQRGSLPDQLCVLIGNEGAGLTAQTLSLCTHRYRLPMRGGAESLNAAVAAAIFMYDLTRDLP
ncbi:MAG: RNA methyltransferase [Candidatus Limiplasma sp.]|nr:RNA methyltransferase [bacterium]MDY3817044.1 RNA methyltransferase [Candidatus Limiplasma sp.]